LPSPGKRVNPEYGDIDPFVTKLRQR
jgi:hypothetical protein